ncbi:MAG: GIY-YIG nuclease family protein [Sulfurisoma sp.]|nr:GIY-YIG nuclease family protein [Sulfurisoma sp.]
MKDILTPPNTIWHLYLIECIDGSLYTGTATDVERRFQEHLSGKGARYTRSHAPVRLVASRPVGSRSEALRAELEIKRLPKGKKLAALLSISNTDQDAIAATTVPRFTACATIKTAVAGKKAAKKK